LKHRGTEAQRVLRIAEGAEGETREGDERGRREREIRGGREREYGAERRM
jgi:hypothetical protein